MTKLQRQRAVHGVAHAYLNLEGLISKKPYFTLVNEAVLNNVAKKEVERLVKHLKSVEQILLGSE